MLEDAIRQLLLPMNVAHVACEAHLELDKMS